MWNAKRRVKDLNLCHRVYFERLLNFRHLQLVIRKKTDTTLWFKSFEQLKFVHFYGCIFHIHFREQDATQGQFFYVGFNRFEFRVFLLLVWLPYQGWIVQSVLSTHSLKETSRNHTFRKGTSAMWKANCLVKDLKLHHCVHSLRWSYLPTPPLGQDMTLGQFLSGV